MSWAKEVRTISWLLSGLGSAAGTVVSIILTVIGDLFDKIVAAVITSLILPLLNATIFKPFNLSASGVVGHTLMIVWATLGAASAGVAIVMIAYGAFSHMAPGGQKSWSEIGEGIAVWAAVLIGGWGFLNLLVGISNAGTQALACTITTKCTAGAHSSAQSVLRLFGGVLTLSHGTAGIATGDVGAAGAVFTALLWPLSGMLLAALAVWVVGVWIMRQVDLVLYAGILPLTAALGINGNKTPFKWAWSEAMGAVFNQLAMAFILWIGFVFMEGVGPKTTILQQFMGLFYAATTFTLAARSSQILGNITGHRSAGSGHVMAGMMAGYLGGRGLAAVAKTTPAGQAAAKIMQGREAQSSAEVTSWAGRPSLGERLKESKMGQAVSGYAASAGAAVAGSSVGQAVHNFGEKHPMAKNAANIVGRGVKGAAKPLQTAASMVYQPKSTLGHMAAQGVANSAKEGPAGTFAQSQAATISMAEHGPVETARQLFGGNTPPEAGTEMFAAAGNLHQLGHLTSANIAQGFNDSAGQAVWMPVQRVAQAERDPAVLKGLTPMAGADGKGVYQTQFNQGAWQSALYQKTQTSVLKNIPVTAPTDHYAMGSSQSSGGASPPGGSPASYS